MTESGGLPGTRGQGRPYQKLCPPPHAMETVELCKTYSRELNAEAQQVLADAQKVQAERTETLRIQEAANQEIHEQRQVLLAAEAKLEEDAREQQEKAGQMQEQARLAQLAVDDSRRRDQEEMRQALADERAKVEAMCAAHSAQLQRQLDMAVSAAGSVAAVQEAAMEPVQEVPAGGPVAFVQVDFAPDIPTTDPLAQGSYCTLALDMLSAHFSGCAKLNHAQIWRMKQWCSSPEAIAAVPVLELDQVRSALEATLGTEGPNDPSADPPLPVMQASPQRFALSLAVRVFHDGPQQFQGATPAGHGVDAQSEHQLQEAKNLEAAAEALKLAGLAGATDGEHQEARRRLESAVPVSAERRRSSGSPSRGAPVIFGGLIDDDSSGLSTPGSRGATCASSLQGLLGKFAKRAIFFGLLVPGRPGTRSRDDAASQPSGGPKLRWASRGRCFHSMEEILSARARRCGPF